MEQYIKEYKEKMQALVVEHLTELDGLKDQLTPIQKQNRSMRFTLAFDERSYKTMNSLMARVAENVRPQLKDKLAKVGDVLRQDAKNRIQST